MIKDNENLSNPEVLSKLLAEAILEKLQGFEKEEAGQEKVITHVDYPRYPVMVKMRKIVTSIAPFFLFFAVTNVFKGILTRAGYLNLSFVGSILTIAVGVSLSIFLVSEVFKGAGLDQEIVIKEGKKVYYEYEFIPSLNRFAFVLFLLGLGFATILLGFASLYTDLLHHNPNHFNGLQDGFLAIYFSIVTFSTVGYGDINPVSSLARGVAICEIFIAMFFSLVVISATLSWVSSYKQQEHGIAIRKRIDEQKNQNRERGIDN